MKKLFLSFALIVSFCITYAQYPREATWLSTINGFTSQDAINGVQKDVVLFVGSSTFTMWSSLKTDFPNSKVLNRGFGGSWMTDAIYFFNQIVAPYKPRQVVLYEGDNDLFGTTKTADQFMDDVITMTRLINIYFPNAKILYVSIKPSPSRTSAFAIYQAANLLMKNYADKYDYIDYADTWTPMLKPDKTPNETLFGSDMLHMNASGYALWKTILEPFLLTSTGEPEPTTDKIIFTESSQPTYHDPSWVNVTAPSTFTTVRAEKISCDSAHFHAGKTSLKIAYQGVTGGSWKACVAAADWVPYDISASDALDFYVYSDAKVDSVDFPFMYLESFTGTTTEKLRMSKYISSIPAAAWTKVTIPVEDWKAKSPSFAYNNVKTIFFNQLNTNATPIVFYLDDVVFKAKADTVPQTNNSGSILIDFGSTATTTSGNWNNITDHQAADTKLIDDQGVVTNITLKVTEPFYNGYNTAGTTTTSGDASIFPSSAASDNFFGHALLWGTTPANPDGIITLSGLDASKYYSFTIFASRTGVTDNRETLYTLTGNGAAKMVTLDPANNTSKVAKLDSIRPDAAGIITFKCEAGVNNNSSNKFFFLGAMKITIANQQTAVNTPFANKLTPYYSNGILKMNEYTGLVKIYDIAGKTICDGQSVFGQLAVKLTQGNYLVKTNSGISKLLVH
jgi:lysophospholipase L1-like esterase